MEKIIYVRSIHRIAENFERIRDDGLAEVNDLLNQGWRVKNISAVSAHTDAETIAYIVLEK